jgi:hypothetical protein
MGIKRFVFQVEWHWSIVKAAEVSDEDFLKKHRVIDEKNG